MARLKRQNARQCLLPDRGRRKIGDVNRPDNEHRVETLTRVRRNRMRALISPLLRLFETLEWQSRNSSPARTSRARAGKPGTESCRLRELEALASALTDAAQRHPYAVAAAVRDIFLIGFYTGMGRGEIFSLRWERVDLDRRILRVDETKTGEPLELPITRQLVAIFERRLEETGNLEAQAEGWVFPSSRSGVGHVAGVGHFHNDISDAGGEKFWFHGCVTLLSRWLSVNSCFPVH